MLFKSVIYVFKNQITHLQIRIISLKKIPPPHNPLHKYTGEIKYM